MSETAAGPVPPRAGDDFALAARSTPATLVIERAVEEAGGRIPFARFMALALGHPEHGYYARAGLRWGAAGDYESSPEVHPIFGYLWARQVAECWERLGRPAAFELIEVGAGSGAFAATLLGWLREREPACFAACRPLLLDGYPRRIEEQRAALAAHELVARHARLADWLAEPSGVTEGVTDGVTGVLLSNELFDALPVHLVGRPADAADAAEDSADGADGDEGDESALVEWYVTRAEGGGFALEPGPSSTAELTRHLDWLGVQPGAGCRQELSLAAPALARALASRLGRGYLLTLDYGYESAELYAPWRREGTLMAFRDHAPQADPLALPGLTDLTAHVDLGALSRALAEEGLEVAPSVTQAEALVALGLGEALDAARERMSADVAAYARERRAAETLVEPTGLGRVRVLVAARGAPLEGLCCLRAVDAG
jgi:SAM-dependent MidA family methyltransferase